MRLSTEILNLIHAGRYEEAEKQINDLLSSSFENKTNYAIALFQLSWLQRGKGQQLTEVALATTAQLAAMAIEINDSYILALALFRRGDISFCKGRLSQAKSDWEQALALLGSASGDSYEIIWLSYHLALAYRDLYGYKIAIPKFQELLQLATCTNPLKYKILRELFFCYSFLKDYQNAYKCFENLQAVHPHFGLDIDIKIFRAHLNILKRNYRGARKILLQAVTETRKPKFGRDRYDFAFHLAYLYLQKRDHTRMFHFISRKTDPIYKLQLLEIAISQGHYAVLNEYELLAFELGITAHIEKAYFHRKSQQTGIVRIDLANNSELNEKEIGFLAVLSASSSVTKNRIAREVLGDSFYEPSYHDPKIYRLVSNINGIGQIILNKNGNYLLNPSSKICFVNSENEKIKATANTIIGMLT